MTDDAAGIVAVDVERGGDDTFLQEVFAVCKAYEARRVVAGGADGAGHGEVLDGGIGDAVEGGYALLVGARAGGRAAEVGRQRVAFAEEGAAERTPAVFVLLSESHRRGDSDVGAQLHHLAAEIVALTDIVGECSPLVRAVDNVGVALRAGMGGQPVAAVELGPYVDAAPRHGEGVAVGLVAAEGYSIAINVGDGDALQRAECLGQPHGLSLVSAKGSRRYDTEAFVVNDCAVRESDGAAIHFTVTD